ncbi:hypothetical protein [Roseivirga sp.]|uniref:hypothetical protein n=1 Tax=Roseivirga sp. TaxID=1964215 RepID=UPI003B51DF17
MSKTPNEQLLFELIQSLTKSEKRSFKLYAKRSGGATETKYIKLFDIMEKMEVYNEELILKKLPGTSKTQFANLKSHLYQQILGSLRLSGLKDDIDIDLREQLDFIRVLYKKGLYYQSLRLLNRAKNITGDYRKDLFQLALLDYEKQIRSQQVFDLEEDQAFDIDVQTDQAMKRFMNVQKFFTLATRLKARFVQHGMVKSEREMNNLKALFYTNLPEFKESELAFNEKFYLYRAYYWFSYLTYDFDNCVTYAEKWVDIFHETGLHKKRRSAYLKGLNRLLQSAFRVNSISKFDEYYKLLDEFEEVEGPTLASNTQVLLLKYKAIQAFNYVFLTTEFEANEERIGQVLKEIEASKNVIDKHNMVVIYYKASVFYFALKKYNESRYYLNKLLNDGDRLRSDLKGYARIISILIDYDTGEEEYMEQKLKAAYDYIVYEENLGKVQQVFLDFMGKIGSIYPQDLKKGFRSLKAEIEKVNDGDFSRKTLLYFDLMSWIEAKIEGRSFAEMVREKTRLHYK